MSDGARRDFEAVYQAGSAPWDIGRPQPELVALAEAGEILGDVLDVGCGTGENALHLAALGRRVVGIDLAPTAVAAAREKAAARGLPVAFLVADALDLGKLRRRFETVVDCGMFHALDPAQRRAYAQSLTEVLSPGGTLVLLCFSDLSPDLQCPAERGGGGDEEPPGPGPYRLSQYEIGEAFRSIFVVSSIRPGRFEANRPGGGARAWVAKLTMI